MSASHTTTPAKVVDLFPGRTAPHARPIFTRPAVIGLDFGRAIPAAAAPVEANRVRDRDLIRARTEGQRAELVSALLLTLEDNPLASCLCYPSRDVGGHPFVIVIAAGSTFRLLPGDCRTAADALVAEQAFPGCMQPARDLREAAAVAEARGPAGGYRNAAEQRANSLRPGAVLTALRRGDGPSRTGRATTLAIGLMIALTVLACGLLGR